MDENSNVTETTEETTTEKRNRISPRVKLGDELVAVIAGTVADLTAEAVDASKTKQAQIAATVAVLNDLKEKVVGIVAAGPVQSGAVGSKHYIGVLENGERVAVDSNVVPRKDHPAFSQFVSVLGSFNTKAGVSLRLTDHTVPCPTVY